MGVIAWLVLGALSGWIANRLMDSRTGLIDNIIIGIKEILRKESPPTLEKKNICKKCAYFDLCFV